jgi:hypothetical protein
MYEMSNVYKILVGKLEQDYWETLSLHEPML